MKKLFLIVSLFFSFYSFAQPVVNRGTVTVTVQDARLSTQYNFIIPRYADTSANAGGANFGANIGLDSCGAIIFTYDNNTLWKRACNPKRWVMFGTGNPSGLDTIYVEAPIAVKYDSSGHQVIYLKTLNGLVSGGVVTQDSCWYLGVSPPIYNIGFKQYVALNTSVHIDSSDVSLNRIDRIVADTFGIISVIKGAASMLTIAPPYNPSIQISIAEVPVPAGSTCVNVTNKVIADENLGVPTEWDFSTVGAIAADPDNTDNPYHLTKAIFVSTYVDSSQIVFTHTALVDTLTSSATLVMPMYLNNAFTNQLQIQFWYNDTAVSSNIVVNPYINTLDTGRYQVVGIPLQYFNFTSQYYNKAVLTWAGWDTSGAGGLYLDYIRIQGGIYNTIQNNWVDSTKIIAGSEYYYKKGIPYLAGAVGGGGGNTNSNIGSGYRLAVPLTNNIKTLFAGTNITLDSAANANGITINSSGSSANFKFNEQFTGSTSTTLTLSQTYISGTIRLSKNGVRLFAADFTEAGATTITLNVPRLSTDIFSVDFNY